MPARKKTAPGAATSDPVDIRPARPGDEALIAEFIAALACYEKAPEANVSTPEALRIQLFGERPAAEVFLAFCGGKPAGFALFFQNFSTWLARPGMYLEDLFVHPEFRNNGIGTALLRHLAAICVERGYGRMEWSCLEWNELAKGRYRGIGAEEMVEWRSWRLEGEKIRGFAEGKPAPRPQAREQSSFLDEEDNATPQKTPAEKPAPEALAPAAETVVIYTDGGCQPNPGTGAWAAVLRCGGKTRELVGGEKETTNNRMELMAAIAALEALKRPCTVELHTDSQYVKNGITSWIHGWKRKNWKRKTGEPVLNVDLWKRLDAAMQRHDVKWAWVRGHAGNEMNERCDELCGDKIRELKRK